VACACGKKRTAATAAASMEPSGTYRVMDGSRKVYESTSKDAAEMVAARFPNATVVPPGA